MQAFVIGNATTDETFLVDEMPYAGASIHGSVGVSDLGGKGANQAIVLCRCGLKTTLIAAVGADLRASIIRDSFRREPLDCRLIEIPGKASDASIIFRLPDGENAIVTTADSAASLQLEDVMPHLSSARQDDFAVLQGNLSNETTRGLLMEAKSIAMITAFNPSPLRASFENLWPLIDIAFLNQGEAQVLTGTTGENAAHWLMRRGVKQVVLTSGGDGAVLVTAEETVKVPAIACRVVDTTGAGDTFMGVALASAAMRSSRIDRMALEHAVKAAAITVSRPGTRSAFPTVGELGALIST